MALVQDSPVIYIPIDPVIDNASLREKKLHPIPNAFETLKGRVTITLKYDNNIVEVREVVHSAPPGS